ncbi:MAG TPA: alanine racemase [Anaerolineaceae bacterium]|mgnify:CR=1 FL=1|nr:alanine racemase [Anaerolineaceae bacterium]HPN50756.1 alanine racemase [Anaerolineaceae bacterium]
MTLFDRITQPTLLLDEAIARRNLGFMAGRASEAGVRFRPHFKTHQSAEIGAWFREAGVQAITVSSVGMAGYFARHGWEDITIAFSLNWRQRDEIRALARQIRLGLLVESAESAACLLQEMSEPADIWIKIDSGNRRTGLTWQNTAAVLALAQQISASPNLRLRGLLTHAGQTYAAASEKDICLRYTVSVDRMNQVKAFLAQQGLAVEVSVGDTPGCSLSTLGPVDEIRPGNFIFYDAQQLALGSCAFENVAVAAACPVVACHPERNEVVVYGGAVHLSKDTLSLNGQTSYGMVCLAGEDRWQAPIPGARVRGLSQEHGMICLPPDVMPQVKVGDLLCIIPAHSCLTVACLGRYLTLDGKEIRTLNCEE